MDPMGRFRTCFRMMVVEGVVVDNWNWMDLSLDWISYMSLALGAFAFFFLTSVTSRSTRRAKLVDLRANHDTGYCPGMPLSQPIIMLPSNQPHCVCSPPSVSWAVREKSRSIRSSSPTKTPPPLTP